MNPGYGGYPSNPGYGGYPYNPGFGIFPFGAPFLGGFLGSFLGGSFNRYPQPYNPYPPNYPRRRNW
ncbi:hypothetical protein DCE79_14135 [Lysinibacillus sp. 2017]|nr:hypothetical protein DCE79_14135 [Lysinibacillus sp. 2017]TGN34976.1 hypothetical protein E4L99_12135 [Lysinibacillus sp. S2017]